MPLSSLPSGGPSIPAGATRVSIKAIDTASTTQKEDVTDLSSEAREYADPPLKEGGANSATATCSATGLLKGSGPQVSASSVTEGWICEDTEEVYEVGKYATWSANWSYYPPQTP
jgi:hypothetical protein